MLEAVGLYVKEALETQFLATTHKAQQSRQKHTPSLSVKQTYLLVLELQSKGQTSGLAHI